MDQYLCHTRLVSGITLQHQGKEHAFDIPISDHIRTIFGSKYHVSGCQQKP